MDWYPFQQGKSCHGKRNLFHLHESIIEFSKVMYFPLAYSLKYVNILESTNVMPQ